MSVKLYENWGEISTITTAQNTLQLPGGIRCSPASLPVTSWLSWLSSVFGGRLFRPFLHFYKPHLSSFCDAYLLRKNRMFVFSGRSRCYVTQRPAAWNSNDRIVGTKGGVNGGLRNPWSIFSNDLQSSLSLQFTNSYWLPIIFRLVVCRASRRLCSIKVTCWLEHQPKTPLLKGLGISADEFSERRPRPLGRSRKIYWTFRLKDCGDKNIWVTTQPGAIGFISKHRPLQSSAQHSLSIQYQHSLSMGIARLSTQLMWSFGQIIAIKPHNNKLLINTF